MTQSPLLTGNYGKGTTDHSRERQRYSTEAFARRGAKWRQMHTHDNSQQDSFASDLRPQINALLDDILQSVPFRTSRQCQSLFRYMVEHSLTGSDDSLRERIIGIEVFGRPPDYDTAEDPVVRLRAADIRKRLAQYYQSQKDGPSNWKIEIPIGSYRAQFSPPVGAGSQVLEEPNSTAP